MLRVVRAAVVTAILLIAGGITGSAVSEWLGTPPLATEAPLGMATPAISVGMLDEPGEMAEDLGAGNPSVRTTARWMVLLDYPFIAGYWLLFVLLAMVQAGQGRRGSRSLASAVVIGITLAAIADVVENQRLLTVISLSPSSPGWTAALGAAQQATAWRCMLLYVSTALVAPIFFDVADELQWGVGLTFIGTGLVGFVGVMWYPPAVAWAFALLVMCVLAVAALPQIAPQWFVEPEVD